MSPPTSTASRLESQRRTADFAAQPLDPAAAIRDTTRMAAGSARSKQALREGLAATRLVAFDVDGTLTDGSIGYVGDHELQTFHVHDGKGIVELVRAGIVVVWITGRGCKATVRRANELGIHELVRLSGPKDRELARIQGELGISTVETVAMGDDTPDLAFRAQAAILACPADAHPDVLAASDWTSRLPGGRGAARELCDAILEARGGGA